ncbi:M24 family metallopeptidase [Spongiimicrobium sp. 3-5]|uniref:M24 family metallopeptidase n=1 Tax=Spongiimicrobium sp. 3-5 TaxID=3332596 RepID=UPI003980126A
MKKITIFLVLVITTASTYSQRGSFEPMGDIENILPVWEQAKIMEKQLRIRQRTVVPQIMERENVDMWLVSWDEYVLYVSLAKGNEEGLVSNRAEALIFYDKDGEGQIKMIEAEAEQISSIVSKLNPSKIAISEEMKEELGAALKKYSSRFVSSEALRTSFLQIRSDEEMSLFQYVARVAHSVIKEVFSNKVIIPDVTTTDEVNWWIRQRYRDLGLLTSDHPTINVQRSKLERPKYTENDEHFRIDIPPRNGYNTIIRRGDIISCDTGIDYLGLGTDTQQNAYVLKKGETNAPEGLRRAFKNTNRLQEIFADEFVNGRPSNDIVNAAIKKAKAEGLRPEIYSHPIPHFLMRYSLNGGFFSGTRYFAGPEMGGEGGEELEPGGGGPVYNNTVYAMELDAETAVPEWGGQDVRLVLEQTIAFTGDKVVFLGGRQTNFYLIK